MTEKITQQNAKQREMYIAREYEWDKVLYKL